MIKYYNNKSIINTYKLFIKIIFHEFNTKINKIYKIVITSFRQ